MSDVDTSYGAQPATGTSASFERAQQALNLIPGLVYPSAEFELLESLGATHLEKLIDSISKKQSTWDTNHGHTTEDLHWFGRFLASFQKDASNYDEFTVRSIVALGAVVSPAMRTFIPTYESTTGSQADLGQLVTDLNRKLMKYWDCYPTGDYIRQELHLEHEPRRAYAVGAFIFSLLKEGEELPLNAADDINIRYFGLQCHKFAGRDLRDLFSYKEMVYSFLKEVGDKNVLIYYAEEMKDDFPTLTFDAPAPTGWNDNDESAEAVCRIGDESFDRSIAVLLDMVAKAEGLDDASHLSAFKLAQLMCSGQPATPRNLVTLLAEWDEVHNAVLLELAEALTETERETALSTLEMIAGEPRRVTSEENLWHCLHALKVAPLMTKIKGHLNYTEDLWIVTPVEFSMPDVWQEEYTGEVELESRGALIKYVVESQTDYTPFLLDRETLIWMGAHANELVPYLRVLQEHASLDRELMESILTTKVMADGVL